MHSPETLTIINRPAIDPVTNKPRWNLIARKIGETIVLPELPEAVHRQNAVLSVLASGISDPGAIIRHSRSAHQALIGDPRWEIAEAKSRYKAATTFELLSLAIADGSVPTTPRPAKEVPTGVATFLDLLTNGNTPEAAATANGVNARDEQQLQHYLASICREFDTKSLYAALRLAHEHGVVRGRMPMQPQPVPSKFVAPNQVGFALPAKEAELALTPRELLVGRARAAGIRTTDIACRYRIGDHMVKDRLKSMYKKLEARDAAEAVTKLIVLKLARPSTRFPRIANNITTDELGVVIGVAQGLCNAEIGDELGKSQSDIKTHLRRLSKDLGAADRVDIVLYMFQLGIFKAE